MKQYFSLVCIDEESFCFELFKIKGRKIMSTGANKMTSQLLGRIPIQIKNTFSIRVNKISEATLGIGVVDREQLKVKTTDYKYHYVIFMYG